ncbi:MAG: ABC-F family ATP-binding cassette domain-containing protein [Bacilli bacterium]|nr:ABC-F family ATP-binding cassette domain-containing protein [Bacilli bacterium]
MIFENLCMEFGTQTIFDNLNIQIKEKDKIGIVGVNGAGKSTLFKLILKELEPVKGRIILPKNTRIGFLPQVISDTISDTTISVFDFLLEARPIKKLELELSELYNDASKETDDKKLSFIMKKIGKVQERLEYWNQYEAESILLKLIDGMKIDENLLDMRLCDLSGGQKSKIAFARLLYSKPEVLLLDEPTNHLDIDSKEFIIEYLKKYNGLILVISHDIEFLNEVTNSTLYINKGTHTAEIFPGNYEKYLKIKNERETSQLRLLEKQEKEEEKLKKIIAKYIRGNEKKANIAKDRQKKLAKLEKEKVVIEQKYKTTNFKIKVNTKSGVTPLKVDNLTFSYDKRVNVLENIRFTLDRGEKFLIVGENGIGKSTLLKLIVGLLSPDEGNIELGYNVKIGYYAQEHELLENDKTIIQNFDDSGLSEKELRALLGNFLFFNDDIYKKIRVLSPGERSRVALAKLAIKDTNFLVLDEPTNHLDPETEKIIAKTFSTYEGTILLVSHNLDFIEDLNVSRMLMLPSGLIKYYDKEIVKHYHDLNNMKK